MPETTVDEDSQTGGRKQDVGSSTHAYHRCLVHAKAEGGSMKRRAQRNLGVRILLANMLHLRAYGLTHREGSLIWTVAEGKSVTK